MPHTFSAQILARSCRSLLAAGFQAQGIASLFPKSSQERPILLTSSNLALLPQPPLHTHRIWPSALRPGPPLRQTASSTNESQGQINSHVPISLGSHQSFVFGRLLSSNIRHLPKMPNLSSLHPSYYITRWLLRAFTLVKPGCKCRTVAEPSTLLCSITSL